MSSDVSWLCWVFGSKAKVKPPFGTGGPGKASGCGFGHDVRTASEHLALFPILAPKLGQNGKRGPSAIGIGPRRQ